MMKPIKKTGFEYPKGVHSKKKKKKNYSYIATHIWPHFLCLLFNHPIGIKLLPRETIIIIVITRLEPSFGL